MLLFHLKEYIRNWIFRLFMAGRNDLSKIAQQDFSPTGYTKKHIANTTVITVYEKDGQVLYFRQCRKHSALRSYLTEAINEYFGRISQFADKEALHRAILADLQKRKNWRRLSRISAPFQIHLMEILAGIYNNYQEVGLPCFQRFDAQEEFISFITFIGGLRICQTTNCYQAKGMYENFSANKLLATYALSRILGVEDLIVPVSVCSFSENGELKVGTMMPKAPGYPPSDLLPQQRRNLHIAAFLKDLTNLEYLDALCYQLDHRLDNYYVTEDTNGKISHVVAFDNDAARTFFVRGKVPGGTYAGCSSVITPNGTVARPYMDKTFADALCACKKEALSELASFMSPMQLRCLWKRMKQLQKAIRKTIAANPDFLVSNWSAADPEKENSPGTYYHLYLTDTTMLDRKELFRQLQKAKKN